MAIETGQYLDLTPNQVIKMGRVGRAQFQKENDPNSLQADGWIEPMPWKISKSAKDKCGAIVFRTIRTTRSISTSPLNSGTLIDEQRPTRRRTTRSTASTARAG